MFDNKGSNHRENYQVEAPTNAFDVLVELYKHRQEIYTTAFKYSDNASYKLILTEQAEKLDEDILHLKLIAADQFDCDSHVQEEDD